MLSKRHLRKDGQLDSANLLVPSLGIARNPSRHNDFAYVLVLRKLRDGLVVRNAIDSHNHTKSNGAKD